MFTVTETSPLPPLVAYYGCLLDETRPEDDPWVVDIVSAEWVIPSLTRTPIAAIRSGEFQGDYVAMVQVPWVLPESICDDEYSFEIADESVTA